MIKDKDPLWQIVKILPTDYKDYGGEVERWQDPAKAYPDCSLGCRHWWALDADWGVCRNPTGPRSGLLTWEHQAGEGCWEHS
jgi:hypothetical protein